MTWDLPFASLSPVEVLRSQRASGKAVAAWDWFWAGKHLAELRRRSSSEQARADAFDRRARIASELAARTRDPAESFLSGNANALACELYRESTYWSLRALADTSSNAPATPEELERLFRSLDPAIIARAAGAEALEPSLRADFTQKTFVEYAELSAEEQANTAERLGRLADALLERAAPVQRQIEAVWFRRTLGIGILGAAVLAIGASLWFAADWSEDRNDLALGRSWRASSTYANAGGCKSPLQSCPESPNYFFHTEQEDKPWLEIDLGSVQSVASVRVENRADCCGERAVPLIVEVGTDQKNFRQVAKRGDTFTSWKAKFSPVRARYVRVRATKRTILHLSRVRVIAR